MILKGMTVKIPDDNKGNERFGTVTEVSERKAGEDGMKTGRGKVKVGYQAGTGAMTEAWFRFDQVQVVKRLKMVVDEPKHTEEELQTVADKKREDTEWVENLPSKISKGVATGDNRPQTDESTFNG